MKKETIKEKKKDLKKDRSSTEARTWNSKTCAPGKKINNE